MPKVLADKIEATPRNGNKSFLSLLWTSDEAHCYLDGQVNSKNNIFWGSQKPDMVATRPLHSKKVTVWCALSERGIIGPFFFEENGKTTTVNSERFIAVLELLCSGRHCKSDTQSNTRCGFSRMGPLPTPPTPPLTGSRFITRTGSSAGRQPSGGHPTI